MVSRINGLLLSQPQAERHYADPPAEKAAEISQAKRGWLEQRGKLDIAIFFELCQVSVTWTPEPGLKARGLQPITYRTGTVAAAIDLVYRRAVLDNMEKMIHSDHRYVRA